MNELEQRRKKFESMGIKLTEQMTSAPVTASNKDVYNKIEQIRRGALKKDMRQLTNAEAPSTSFQSIPVKKPRQNPNKTSSEYSVEPKSFVPKSSPELSEIDRMFGGDDSPSSSFSSSQYIEQRPMNTSISIDNIGPSFSPDVIRSQMQQKMKEKYGFEPSDEKEMVSSVPNNLKNRMNSENEQVLNYYHIKDMIREMIQEEAEGIIRKVLDEYLNKSKKQNQNVFEIVDAKKGLIKIKGNVYKLSKP